MAELSFGFEPTTGPFLDGPTPLYYELALLAVHALPLTPWGTRCRTPVGSYNYGRD